MGSSGMTTAGGVVRDFDGGLTGRVGSKSLYCLLGMCSRRVRRIAGDGAAEVEGEGVGLAGGNGAGLPDKVRDDERDEIIDACFVEVDALFLGLGAGRCLGAGGPDSGMGDRAAARSFARAFSKRATVSDMAR